MVDFKEKVYLAYKEIVDNGLVIGSWGNVSCYIESSEIIIITPSGISIDNLSPKKMVSIDVFGNIIDTYSKPSVDMDIHLEIYKGFSGVGSVIHTHSEYATIFSQAKLSIPCVGTTHSDYFYNDIPLVNDLNKDEIDNEFEMNSGKSIVNFFNDNEINPLHMKAALLPSHGPVVWGESIEDAVESAIVLEHISKLAYRTLMLKNPKMDSNLIDKHFFRKHGKDKYYGQ